LESAPRAYRLKASNAYIAFSTATGTSPAAMLFWALMASGQITMRRVDGWQTLDQAPLEQPLDLAA